MCSWHGRKMLEHGAQAVARQAHSSNCHHLMNCLMELIMLDGLEGLVPENSNVGSQLLPLEKEKVKQKRS